MPFLSLRKKRRRKKEEEEGGGGNVNDNMDIKR